MEYYEVAYVILNYNDNDDLFHMLPLLEKQTQEATFIIVDNNSIEKNYAEIKRWVEGKNSYYITDKELFYQGKFEKNKRYYLVRNSIDAGFSGGNNVGFRVASLLGIKFALLVSPDVYIQNMSYMEIMLNYMQSEENIVVAGSDIIGLDNLHYSPQNMPTFSEEFFWLFYHFKDASIRKFNYTHVISDEKLHGCCMLFDVAFLKSINYLDENVFMYCEEPILTRRVQKAGGDLLYISDICALHAHDIKKKGNSSLRMLMYIKSRKYYIWKYSRYSYAEKVLLTASYQLRYILHCIKYKLKL